MDAATASNYIGIDSAMMAHGRGYSLVCGEFSFDGGDCDGDGTSDGDGGPPTGDGGGTPSGGAAISCGDDMVFDCDMECVSSSITSGWVGDGICDDGDGYTNLDCAEFDFDGGDCDNAAVAAAVARTPATLAERAKSSTAN